jgi:hypothetical protein
MMRECVRWNWKIRADLLDQDLERAEMQEHMRYKQRSARMQAKLGRALQKVALRGAEVLVSDHSRLSEMSGNEIAKLADVGVKVERLANNDPTQIEADKTVRIVWEGPRPDWAPDDSASLPAPEPLTLEGER